MKNVHGELLYKIFQILEMTDYNKVLWLENDEITDKTEYLFFTLNSDLEEFMVPFHRIAIDEMINTILEQGEMQDVNIAASIVHMDESHVEITMEVTYDLYYAPFYFSIQKKSKPEVFPEEREYVLDFDRNQKVKLLHYPMEDIAVEHIVEILKNLELIGDMGHYYYLYKELEVEAFSARKVQALLHACLTREGISIDEKRMKLWSSYGEYTYMKKRWKSYIRRRSTVDWKTVYDRIAMFLMPILQATAKNEIYIGDWMPSLGRYLD